MTVAVPVAVLPWKVTEQLPADRIQLEALRVPPVVPADSVKVTVPVGVREAVVVSVTVAVHVDVPPMLIGVAHETAVDVLSNGVGVTVIVFEAVGPLPLWFASPTYVPLTAA